MTAAVAEIVRAGMLTTVQDLGRPGLGAGGISPAGAMDPLAHRLANVLCGNDASAAALEITGPGAEFRFLAAHRFAIAGADLGATLAGVALPARFVGVAAAGDRLAFTARRRGARVCLALAGGIAAARVFGSVSADLAGGLGGGVLRAGTALAVGPGAAASAPAIALTPGLLRALAALDVDRPGSLRYVPEPGGGAPAAAHAALARRTFRVSHRSNRTGFRFEGDALPVQPDPDRLSQPTAPGAIQLPPDGLPILLMADRNPTGGYPRLGHLVSADRARAAQLWPGDEVGFVAVSLTAALAATRRTEAAIARALAAIVRHAP
jgi:biotin-dependent carboxylase-like uncharacterized protein